MNSKVNHKEKSEIELASIQFERLLRFSLICGILIVSGFIVYYIMTPEEGYIGFGILNKDERAEDYPTTAKVNESIGFYVTVENELDHDFTFKVIIFLGNKDTKLTPDEGSKHANKTSTTDKETLKPSEDWMSKKLYVKFPYNGTDQILIVELWKYNEDNSREFWDILWLRIDVYS
ncbi:MAG: DUF1616 domain-containing protein [Promethearchaeota archaeon]